MLVHVSYQFQVPSGNSGFGDCTIANVPRRIADSADLESLRKRIKEQLAEDGQIDANVVLLAWHEIYP